MDRKDMILNNALRQFNEKGFVGTSISDIAKESGISKSTIFHYFVNKEDLFNQVFLKCKEVYSKNTIYNIKDINDKNIKEILQFQYNHIEELKFFNQFEYSPYISQESRDIVALIHKPTLDYIKEEQKNHRMVDLDPTFICMFIVNTFVSNFDVLFKDGEIDIEYGIKLKDFIMKALA